MKIINHNKIGFWVYSYYQAKDILFVSRNYKMSPFICFKYNIVNEQGLIWISEISKLLLMNYKKNDFKIIIDCKKNPALAINCIKYNFSYIKFDGNKVLQKKIKSIVELYKVDLNPEIHFIDLKRIKKCRKFVEKLLINYKKEKKNE